MRLATGYIPCQQLGQLVQSNYILGYAKTLPSRSDRWSIAPLSTVRRQVLVDKPESWNAKILFQQARPKKCDIKTIYNFCTVHFFDFPVPIRVAFQGLESDLTRRTRAWLQLLARSQIWKRVQRFGRNAGLVDGTLQTSHVTPRRQSAI